MERNVLVTGSNSGIGLATALHLADLGFRVIGSARTADKAAVIEDAARGAGSKIETVVLDVRDEASCEAVIPELALWGLVNNAGYMNVGTVEDVAAATVRSQFETLVFAPLRLAQVALPGMRRRGEGRIVNVSSTSAHTSGPFVGWYSAAKHALAAVTEAFRTEVAGWGIDVVAVEPGGVRTAIWDKAERDLNERGPTSNTPLAYERARAILEALRPRMSDAGKVAAVVGEALVAGRPRPVYKVGPDAWMLPPVFSLAPSRWRSMLARKMLGL